MFLLESGEFIKTSSNADISKTENLLSIFYCVSEIYVKFRVFRKKKISLKAEVLRKLLTAKQVAT